VKINILLPTIFLVFLKFACVHHSFAQQAKTDSLEKLLKKQANDTVRVLLLSELCWQYRSADPKKALEYGEEGLNLAKTLDYKKGIADLYNTLGIVYYLNSKILKSIECHKEALKISEELNIKRGIAKSYNNLSINYSELADFKNALDYAFKNLKIQEELNNKVEIAKAFNNIGLIYYKQSYDNRANINDALSYYEKALKIREEIHDEEGTASTLYNLGQAYTFSVLRKKENDKNYDCNPGYDSVLKYYNRSIAINTKIGNLSKVASINNVIGNIYGEKGQYNEALSHYNKSLEMSRLNDFKREIVVALYNIGCIKSKQKKYKEALNLFNQSLKLAEEIEYKDFVKENYRKISNTYFEIGNYKEAYSYYVVFSAVKDSIYTKESSDFQNNIVSQYEDEKKQQQIKLLNQENDLKQQRLKNNRLIIYATSFGLVLLLILTVVILNGYRQKQKTNKLLEAKNAEIGKKNKDITDSIKYAQRIQKAILPAHDFVSKLLPEHFIIYLPKDIVSGDFYWVEHKDNKTLFSAVDCTGHGVPGAFMSILGRNLLNQAVNEYNITKPSEILNYLNNGLIETFKHSQGQNIDSGDVKDGMDIALGCLYDNFTKLEYSGAYNPLYVIRNKCILHFKADVYPIGTPFNEKLKSFTNNLIELQKNDTIYIFSDGFVDQFGGVLHRKKFSSKRFRETLLEIQDVTMAEQKKILVKTFEEWKGNTSQLDDVLIIGIRV